MEHVQQTPSSGDLRQYMLSEIFLKAVLHQFSGILDIENDQVTKMIYFKNGNVVFVESNDREELFGQFLMRRKLIDPKALNEALQELANQKDLKIGEVLLKRGLIDPNSLMEMLNLHQEEKLLNAFAIKTGNFRMITNMEWPEYVTTFPFRTLNVFFTAVEKYTSQEEIQSYTGIHALAMVQIKHQPSRDLPLPPFATRLMNSLNRNLISVGELAEKMSMPIEKVINFLFIFKLAQWIEVERTAPAAKVVNPKVEEAKKNLPPEAKPITNEEMVEKKEINPLLLQRLEIEYKTLESQNFYQIFNVGLEFTAQQIQTKFFQVISEFKKYEEINKGKEMVTWVKTAYEVLRDPKMKSIYDRRFAFRKKDPKTESAEKSFYRALRLIDKNDLDSAYKVLDVINAEVPDSTFRAYKALVFFKQNPQTHITDALSMIEEAFAIYAADPFAHYIAGQLYQHKKNFQKAEGHYRSAIQVFAGFTEAITALDGLRFEKTKERMVGGKEKEKEKDPNKPGFFDLSVGGFKLGGKD